jgi:hypothetical protein
MEIDSNGGGRSKARLGDGGGAAEARAEREAGELSGKLRAGGICIVFGMPAERTPKS